MGNLESSALFVSHDTNTHSDKQTSDDLRILADASKSQEERREPFLRLRNKFAPNKRTDQEYAKELSRVFSLRFPIWDNSPPYMHYMNNNATTYSRASTSHAHAHAQRLSNAIRGCIYGAALGDAMGIATEFLSKEAVKSHYGPGCDFFPGLSSSSSSSSSSCDIFADVHRLSFAPGDWTDDTDHLILALQSILETGGIVDPINFAHKLLRWVECGFPELGDESGTGLGQTTKRVVRSRGYVTDPINVAKDVWIKYGGRKAAPNGALMRTAIVGIVSFWDLHIVERNALTLCQATHADPRCVASCVAVSCCLALILQAIASVDSNIRMDMDDINRNEGDINTSKIGTLTCMNTINIEAIVSEAMTRAFSIADCTKEQEEEFQRMISFDNISELDLDCPEGMGYTFRCASCAIVTMKRVVKSVQQQQKQDQEQQQQNQQQNQSQSSLSFFGCNSGDREGGW